MTSGPDGAVWFTGYDSDEARVELVGRIDAEGQVQRFEVPGWRRATNIAAGPDGNLWFAGVFENENAYSVARIGRLSLAGELTEYKLGNHVGLVRSITAGPDGAVWFTTTYWVRERLREEIGRIDSTGSVTRFRLPQHSDPSSIVLGPDGNLWLTLHGPESPAIGRITPRGKITRFDLPGRDWVPGAITAGPGHSLLFGETFEGDGRDPNGRIGRITTHGRITHRRVPSREGPLAIAVDPSGRAWFIVTVGLRTGIGWMTPDGGVSRLPCLEGSCEVVPDALTIGPEGAPWFAAHKYRSHGGGGGSAIFQTILEEEEPGFIGRFGPR